MKRQALANISNRNRGGRKEPATTCPVTRKRGGSSKKAKISEVKSSDEDKITQFREKYSSLSSEFLEYLLSDPSLECVINGLLRMDVGSFSEDDPCLLLIVSTPGDRNSLDYMHQWRELWFDGCYPGTCRLARLDHEFKSIIENIWRKLKSILIANKNSTNKVCICYRRSGTCRWCSTPPWISKSPERSRIIYMSNSRCF